MSPCLDISLACCFSQWYPSDTSLLDSIVSLCTRNQQTRLNLVKFSLHYWIENKMFLLYLFFFVSRRPAELISIRGPNVNPLFTNGCAMLVIFLTIAITNRKHSHLMQFTFPQKWSWGRFWTLGGNFMLSLWLIASEYYLSHPLGLQWSLCFICWSWVILETVENIVDESLCSCTLTKRINMSWTKLAYDNSSARQWRGINKVTFCFQSDTLN